MAIVLAYADSGLQETTSATVTKALDSPLYLLLECSFVSGYDPVRDLVHSSTRNIALR